MGGVDTKILGCPLDAKQWFLLYINTSPKVHISGARLSEVYEATVKYVQSNRPELVEKLTKNFGFGMGIEFREAALLITNKTNVRAKKGEL